MDDRTKDGVPTLIVGTKMHCPRCLNLVDILSYKPLGLADNFKSELSPIYRCRNCSHLFAPGQDLAAVLDSHSGRALQRAAA